MAVEAGFVGIHGVDPIAGMDLVRLKREFGSIASCNSICEGMNPDAVLEMFRYEEEVGS